MKKILVSLFTLFTLAFVSAQISFAACPYKNCQVLPFGCTCSPCCDCCCEDWLNCLCFEDYFCYMRLSECQKCEARKAIEEFKCCTQCLRAKNCKCESKRECRQYRKALRKLDCKMRNITTSCQKYDYKCVRKEIKDKIEYCHKCFIWPFYIYKNNYNCCS